MATPAEALRHAFDLAEAGRAAEAEVLCRRILEVAPDLTPAAHLLGALLCGAERFVEAIPHLGAATRAGAIDAARTLTKALIRIEDLAGAERGSRLAAALDPADAEVWDLVGVISRRRGDGARSLGGLERAVRLAPGDPGPTSRLALALRERGRERLGETDSDAAFRLTRRSLELAPDDVETRRLFATAALESGRIPTALDAHRRLAALAPETPRTLRGLGVAHSRAGQRDEAGWALTRAARLDPDDPTIWDVLTQIRLDDAPGEAAAASARAIDARLERSRRSGDELVLFAAPGRPPDARRDVISVGLWGDLKVYLDGAIALTRAARDRYPGWVVRVHHDRSVPGGVLEELALLGAETIERPSEETRRLGSLWRFLPFDDPAVRRVLVRDCDSRLTAREVAAVRDWIASDRPFHVMRDHLSHTDLILAGMWGGRTGELPAIEPALRRFAAMGTARWTDQDFLADWLWPKIARRVLVHDGVHPDAGLAFPLAIDPDEGHVGAKVFPLRISPAAIATDDPLVRSHLDALGDWMGLESAALIRLIAPGDRVVDTDPGPGTVTRALARAGARVETPTGDRATAFEGRPIRLARVALRGADDLVIDAALRARPDYIHLRVDDDRAGALAVARLMGAGYRARRHLIPAFDPDNPKRARVGPEPGLLTVAVLAVREGGAPPPFTAPEMAGPDEDWRPWAWRLRWDGSVR